MLKKNLLLFMVALATVLMTALQGHAVSRPGTTVSAVAGWFLPGGAETLETGPLLGFKLGKSLTEVMDVEGDLTLIQAGKDSRAYELTFQCLYKLWETPKWDVFMTVGAGGALAEGSQGSGGVLLDLGLSGKYNLRPDLALRADLRQVIVTGSIGNNIELAMGLAYYFDSDKDRRPRQRLRPLKTPDVAPPAAPAPVIEPATALPEPVSAQPEAASKPAMPEPTAAEPEVVTEPVAPTAARPEPEPAGEPEAPPAAEPGPETVPQSQSLGGPPIVVPAVATEAQLPVPAAVVTRVQAPVEPPPPLRVVQTIKFEPGSAFIAKKYYPKLQIVVNAMKKNPDAKAVISGHADDTGPKARNVTLSALRADSVIYQLTKAGIDRSRLSRKVYGASSPAASNRSKASKAQNRRAVTVVTAEVK